MAWLLAWGCAGCATAGPGDTPALPGVPSNDGDSGSSSDDGSAGDGAGLSGDDGSSPAGEADSGSTCDDVVHSLRALFAIPPMTCAASTDCPSGDCCYVGSTGSACVMQ